jgi:hypothetical protein
MCANGSDVSSDDVRVLEAPTRIAVRQYEEAGEASQASFHGRSSGQ